VNRINEGGLLIVLSFRRRVKVLRTSEDKLDTIWYRHAFLGVVMVFTSNAPFVAFPTETC